MVEALDDSGVTALLDRLARGRGRGQRRANSITLRHREEVSETEGGGIPGISLAPAYGSKIPHLRFYRPAPGGRPKDSSPLDLPSTLTLQEMKMKSVEVLLICSLPSENVARYFLTFLILLGTFREDILRSRVDAVSVEIVRLEKASPELLLRHVMRHIFIVLLLHCAIKEKNVRN